MQRDMAPPQADRYAASQSSSGYTIPLSFRDGLLRTAPTAPASTPADKNRLPATSECFRQMVDYSPADRIANR